MRAVFPASTFAIFAVVHSLAFGADAPFSSLPYTPSLDVKSMDRSIDPCQDLYRYSCGGWIKNNPIPSDQAGWSVYDKLATENLQYLWGILKDASSLSATRTATQQKIGDYFDACMNVDAIEKLGTTPIAAELAKINVLKSKAELASLLGSLHAGKVSNVLFRSGVEQDAKDSSVQIFAVVAGGIGLPDRDYYLKTDSKSKEIRQKYLEHVAKIFSLLGDSKATAQKNAATVLRLETRLAKASLSRVDRRDPYKVYHRNTVQQLSKMVPVLAWESYYAAIGGKPGAWLNVSEPAFFAEVNKIIRDEPLIDLKTYLRWSLADESAPYLSKAFVDENFAFYRAVLRGVKEDKPRWKKCVAWVDNDLGEALGKEFVDRTFTAAMKSKTNEMTDLIVAQMKRRIDALAWMSTETKKQAFTKLARIRSKVGYPDRWRDYGTLDIKRGDFFGNVSRASEFETKRQLNKIGKPVDKDEWGMTPPTVNAYYNASMNDINFPAGVLLPPLYDFKLDDAPNYGNTGSTIGHELTHGFDDEGRKFDANGNLRDWWTKADGLEFEKRANCVRDQYAAYTVIDDIKINSELTSGEDIADLGGTIIALEAWKEATKNMKLETADGLTPEQRFFVGFAQWACADERPESLRVHAATDPHSPPFARINGVVVNMPQFAKAFKCKEGAAMTKKPSQICKVW